MCYHHGIEMYALVVLSPCQSRAVLYALVTYQMVTAEVGLPNEFYFDPKI